jgi:predicted DNA-binding transcriptional regulator AlpA
MGFLKRIRGATADAEDRWLSVKDLVAHSSLSAKTLRGYLKRAHHPIPFRRIKGRIVIRKSEYDQWVLDEDRQPGDPPPTPARNKAFEARFARAIKSYLGQEE